VLNDDGAAAGRGRSAVRWPMLRSASVLVVGLTGGIGSGKSTVSGLLADRGAVIIDADAIVRELQAPGGEAYVGIVDRFGAGVVAADGTLDRPALAALVFNDEAARADLNKLTHPLVGREMMARLAAEAATDHVVVMDIPLLAERGGKGAYPVAAIIVVDCPVDVAVSRLVEFRGFSEADARARVAAQISREERLAIADRVVDNGGTVESLERQVAELWVWLEQLRAEAAAAEPEDPPASA
jgi:dephospho-CoA kinase